MLRSWMMVLAMTSVSVGQMTSRDMQRMMRDQGLVVAKPQGAVASADETPQCKPLDVYWSGPTTAYVGDMVKFSLMATVNAEQLECNGCRSLTECGPATPHDGNTAKPCKASIECVTWFECPYGTSEKLVNCETSQCVVVSGGADGYFRWNPSQLELVKGNWFPAYKGQPRASSFCIVDPDDWVCDDSRVDGINDTLDDGTVFAHFWRPADRWVSFTTEPTVIAEMWFLAKGATGMSPATIEMVGREPGMYASSCIYQGSPFQAAGGLPVAECLNKTNPTTWLSILPQVTGLPDLNTDITGDGKTDLRDYAALQEGFGG